MIVIFSSQYTAGKFEIQRRENRCILRIKDSQPDDEGEYSCVCGENSTKTSLTVEGAVSVFIFNSWRKSPFHTVICVYSYLNHKLMELRLLRCYQKSHFMLNYIYNCPWTMFHWYHLLYRNFEDVGNCFVNLPIVVHLMLMLCLTSEPECEFLRELDDVEAAEHDKATFECDISDPEAEVTWQKNGKVWVLSLDIQSLYLFTTFNRKFYLDIHWAVNPYPADRDIWA